MTQRIKLLLLLMLQIVAFMVRLSAQNCDFHIKTEVTQATCYNNGKVLITPVDSEGNELFIAESIESENTEKNLSAIKYGYRSLTSGIDTMQQWSFDNLLVLDTGRYVVGAQVICFDSTKSGDDRYSVLEAYDTVTITTSYNKPKLSLIVSEATSTTGYGTIPTLVCSETGRVQMRIYDGKFPYMIRICDENQVPFDTIYFDTTQYNGNNVNRYDYHEYYSVENLGTGKYFFFVEDGCDYHLPMIWENIQAVQPPTLTDIFWYDFSGSYADSNVIRTRLTVNIPNVNYSEIPFFQYRFIHNDIKGITDTTNWKDVPNIKKPVSGNNYITVYDTVSNASGYCDIYGKNITMEVRMKVCSDTINMTRTHSWNYPTDFFAYQVWVVDSARVYPAVYDSCGYYTEYDTSFGHYEPAIRFYNSNEYFYKTTSGSSNTTASANYQVTYPLYWIYTDNAGNTLKIDTIRKITYPVTSTATQSWSASNGATGYPASRLRAEDIEPFYGEITETALTIPITRTLYNAQGCLIYTRTDNITYKKQLNSTSSSRKNISWSTSTSVDYSYDYCCLGSRAVRLYTVNIPEFSKIFFDSTIVELYESPLNNKYNFTGVYHLDTHSMTFEIDSVSNMAVPVFSASNITEFGVALWQNCLPSGVYKWRISNMCNTWNIPQTVTFNDIRTWTYDKPEFETRAECTNLWIKPKNFNLYLHSYNNYKSYRHSNGQVYYDVYDTTTAVSWSWKIIKNLDGNNTTFSGVERGKTDSARVTGKGRYVIEIRPSTSLSYSNSYCTPPILYDTITFEGGTIDFQYALSYVCDENADTGFVRVKAKDGTEPYTYTLYSGKDKTGDILGTNQTGYFSQIPLHDGQQISVYAEDQCYSSFPINVTVFDLEKVKKAWFLGDLQQRELCEGNEVEMFSIGLDDSVKYHWTGPYGFEAFTRDTKVFLPRDADTGWYKVQILNTGCINEIAEDSVRVDVIKSPQVTILDDATVCPGEEVKVNFIVQGEGDVKYTISYQENSIVIESSHTNNDSLIFTAMAPRTFWVKEVADDRCTYTIPEDTVRINITSHMATACNVTTSSETICIADNGTVFASSDLQTPYYLKWYRDYEQTELLRIDTMFNSSEKSQYDFVSLVNDTSVYVTASNADYCETRYGTMINWLNMSSGTTVLKCAESIKFYDDGGPNEKYSPNVDLTRVFISEDNQPITLTFESLNLLYNYAKFIVYNGNTTNQDSIIAIFTGNYADSIPAPIISKGNALTVRFVSRIVGDGTLDGWVAEVSNNPQPAAATIHVFDTISANITDVTTQIRYDGSAQVKATAFGGRGEKYKYVWQTSTDGGETWTDAGTQTLAEDSCILELEHLTQSTRVKVTVTDASTDACDGVSSAQVDLPVSHIKLALNISAPNVPTCEQDYPVTVTIRNYGLETADSVYAKVKLSDDVVFNSPSDSLMFFETIAGGQVIDTVISVHSYIVNNTPADVPVKAQIWYCVEGDSVPTVTYGDWDWQGAPRQIDEDIDTMHIMPFLSTNDYGIVGFNDTVCYNGNAVLTASSDVGYPQYIRWFGDKTLRNLLKVDTINSVSDTAKYALNNLQTETTLYVTIENNDYCTPLIEENVNSKLNLSETMKVTMSDGSTIVGIYDKVKFYDSGDANKNYSDNEDYTHTFKTGIGEIALRINKISLSSGDAFTIYDGENTSGVPIAHFMNTSASGKLYTSTTGALTIYWHSNATKVSTGWDADVVNTITYKSAQATACLYTPLDAVDIITEDQYICYGDSAVLKASTSIDAPQYFTWYDSYFNVLKKDTTNIGNSSLTVYNQTRQNAYYVSVGNDENCPAFANNSTTITDIVGVDKEYDILLNSSTHNQVTVISPADVFGFYDDGGSTTAYSNAAGTFVHTFSALQGVVQADLTGLYISANDHLYVYDGAETNDDNLIADISGQIGRRQFFSTGNSMTFKLFTHGNTNSSLYGWIMSVSSVWQQALAEADVYLNSPEQDVTISASSAAVCYNDPAELTATSDSGVYYTWFASDGRTVLFQDTAANHTSTYDIDHVRKEDLFYIVTTPEGSCPIIVPYQYTNVNLNIGTNGKTTIVGANDYINFYDDGGASANYSYEKVDYNHTFKAEYGNVYARFTTHMLSSRDTLFVYDGSQANADSLLGLFATGNSNPANSVYNFKSTNNCLTFRLKKTGESSSNGWVANITSSPIEAQTVLLNPLTNGKTTYLSPIDSVLFYDDGGGNGEYTPLERTLNHNFTALQGNVKIKFKTGNSFCSNDIFYIYDGKADEGELIGSYTGSQLNNQEFVSSGKDLGIKFSTQSRKSSCQGFEATVTPVYNLDMAQADVTIKMPNEQQGLITTDDFVCYGDTAHLLANSNKLVYPQYYTWYNASMSEVFRDTLQSYGEHSTLTLPNQTYDTFYLVQAQYGTECPSILPLNSIEIPAARNGYETQTTIVDYNDYIVFYDNGGLIGVYTHTFTSKNNKQIVASFSTPKHLIGTSSRDTLFIYDGPTADDEKIIAKIFYSTGVVGPFTSTSSSLTFKLVKNTSTMSMRWSAVISESDKINVSELRINQVNNNKTTIVFPSDCVFLYDEGGANSYYEFKRISYSHTFKAMSGNVKFNLNYCRIAYDTLFVYSGTEVKPSNLIATIFSSENDYPTYSDTALTIRFSRRSGIIEFGWGAYITSEIPNLLVDTAYVAIHSPLTSAYVSATNDVVCYDESANLMATSEIAFPQYFTWYNYNMSEVLLRDTVDATKTHSTFNPEHQISDSLYHVIVYNDTACPYLPDVYDYVVANSAVSVNPTYYDTLRAVTCQSDELYTNGMFAGIDVSESGTLIIDSVYTTINNCDSIHTLILTVNPSFVIEETAETCDNETFVWAGHLGKTIPIEAGVYTIWDSLHTENGCDSVFKLTLKVKQTYLFEEKDTTCVNADYVWDGHESVTIPSTEGDYIIWDSLKTENGCDSIFKLNLHIGNPQITITCPPDYYDTLGFGDCVMNVYSDKLGTPTVISNTDWPIEVTNERPEDDLYYEGENIVTWIATDTVCGYSESCEQKVIIVFPKCPDAVDCEGNVYHGVRIGCDCWTQRNLESNCYGDANVCVETGTCEEEIPCVYKYESSMYPDVDENVQKFGKLYCGEAAVGNSTINENGHIRGICPEGWYLPTSEKYEGLNEYGADAIKSPLYWIDGGGNNSTLFSWLPAGFYNGTLERFEGLMSESYFWSTDIKNGDIRVVAYEIKYNCDTVKKVEVHEGLGYSVRCIKEKENKHTDD